MSTLREIANEADTERSLVAAIAADPKPYWEVKGTLPPGIWTDPEAAAAWEALKADVEAGRQPKPVPVDWSPCENVQDAANELHGAFQRRIIADVAKPLMDGLNNRTPPAEALTAAKAKLSEAETKLAAGIGSRALRCRAVVESVMHKAERWAADRANGKTPMGLPSGIASLDKITGGFEAGLYMLGGPPGAGKTTLALQFAVEAAKQENAAAVYVTFENSPENLALKQIAARAGEKGVNTQDIRRGLVPTGTLLRAAHEWAKDAEHLWFIEGTGKLTVPQIRARVLEAMAARNADRALIVVDYLQLYAKASVELRKLGSTRERVEALTGDLRELAISLDSPVLALSSLSRGAGGYGEGEGVSEARLDSLKESGDIEYAADVVWVLAASKTGRASAPARALTLHIKKNRNGDVGTVELIFRPDRATMREPAR